MSGTIQNPAMPDPTRQHTGSTACAVRPDEQRLEFWRRVGEVFGLPLTFGQEHELAHLDDLAVVDRFFPHLSDPERHEVLWAAGEDERRSTDR